jgi:hypothetical protein
MYKKVWLEIGGHDVQFRRSREDSDIYTRLVLNNIKVQQAWNAIVYHFTCTSSRGLNWFDSTNKEAQNRIQLQNIADQFELFKFMRKWGKFHHSYTKPKYYNITAIINGDFNATSAQKITFIEPFFKKIQFQDTKFIDHIKAQYNQSQEPANTILSISKDQWDEYKYFFQTDIVTNRLLPISEQDSDISVKFDIDEIGQEDITGFIHNLQDIIDGVEDTGHFEYGPFFITINQKVDRASDNIRVINPELKPEHLYTIH